MLIDLALVVPVYNEEACIVDVIKSWRSMLNQINIDFLILILNDGSTDHTKERLEVFSNDDRIKIFNKKNSGHGPTIHFGYLKAVHLAKWVFQCDSDDEMKPDYFPYLWEKRENFDALFGVRQNRDQNLIRKFISISSKMTVHLLFGMGVTDVNTPYRLIRSSILAKIVKHIPNDIFAPNIIISGALSKSGLRIYEHPVPHENRKTGAVSIDKRNLWKSAFRSFWQTFLCRSFVDILEERSTNSDNHK